MKRDKKNTVQCNLPDAIMPPAWLVFPGYRRGSMNWRMGAGEYYLDDFNQWKCTLSREQKKSYDHHFPEPLAFRSRIEFPKYFKGTQHHQVCFWTSSGRPEFTLEDLQRGVRCGKQYEYVYFWKPRKNGTEVNSSVLSQWWLSDFILDNSIIFSCAEQYMMAEKALLFHDKDIYAQIRKCGEANRVKKLGRKVNGFQQDIWEKCKYSIVLNGNYQKFMQNAMLKEYLLSTGDKVLVEASPYDEIWGIKMEENDPSAKNPLKWKGQNLLGFALMEVRKEIRRVCKYETQVDWSAIREKYLPKRPIEDHFFDL